MARSRPWRARQSKASRNRWCGQQRAPATQGYENKQWSEVDDYGIKSAGANLGRDAVRRFDASDPLRRERIESPAQHSLVVDRAGVGVYRVRPDVVHRKVRVPSGTRTAPARDTNGMVSPWRPAKRSALCMTSCTSRTIACPFSREPLAAYPGVSHRPRACAGSSPASHPPRSDCGRCGWRPAQCGVGSADRREPR